MFTIDEISLNFNFGVPCIVFDNADTKEKITIKQGSKKGVFLTIEYKNNQVINKINYDNEFLLKTRIIEILNNVH